MSTNNSNDVEQRLAAAERELLALRLQIASLKPVAHRAVRHRLALAAVLAVPLTAPWWVSAADYSPGTTVKAPFTVVNKANKPILVVYEGSGFQGLSIRNQAGNPAASLSAFDGSYGGSGSMSIYDGAAGASSGVSNNMFQVKFTEGGKIPELQLGGNGNSSLKITGDRLRMDQGDHPALVLDADPTGGSMWAYGKSGSVVASLGATSSGQNALLQMASDGKDIVGVALGTTSEGNGALHVFEKGILRSEVNAQGSFKAFNGAGQVLAEIGSVQSGNAGRLWLGNAAGAGVVEAGMLADGKGTVRAGPVIGGLSPDLVQPDRLVGKIK
jgi:hypothetical protein